uniref:Uncharacterized protein n=1 Tax=Ditylenchus dipsaci TaxID=166011 RepID=A0A915DIS9_9BILA
MPGYWKCRVIEVQENTCRYICRSVDSIYYNEHYPPSSYASSLPGNVSKFQDPHSFSSPVNAFKVVTDRGSNMIKAFHEIRPIDVDPKNFDDEEEKRKYSKTNLKLTIKMNKTKLIYGFSNFHSFLQHCSTRDTKFGQV